LFENLATDRRGLVFRENLIGDKGQVFRFRGGLPVASRNHLAVLPKYGLLDHPSRLSVDRKCNIPLSAIALRHIRKGDEKASGTFDDPDVMDQKAIIEANGSIGFDKLLVG
jgi:hypothetical protein